MSPEEAAPGGFASLLERHANGDSTAFQEAIALAYADIHAIARRVLRSERELTLRPTALAHEAYLRLSRLNEIKWKNRAHLLAVAAQVTRQAILDEARRYRAGKRQGGQAVTLSDTNLGSQSSPFDAVDIDLMLRELEGYDPEAAQVVTLKVFGDLSVEEMSEYLGISVATVNRRWASGKAWLVRELCRPL